LLGKICGLAESLLWLFSGRWARDKGLTGNQNYEEHRVVAVHRFDCGQLAWQVLFIDRQWRALKLGQEIVLI